MKDYRRVQIGQQAPFWLEVTGTIGTILTGYEVDRAGERTSPLRIIDLTEPRVWDHPARVYDGELAISGEGNSPTS